MSGKLQESMLVSVRIKSGLSRGRDKSILMVENEKRIVLKARRQAKEIHHQYHRILGDGTDNYDVFRQTVAPLMNRSAKNDELAIVCFGQTGCGKTQTIFGNENEEGLAQLAVDGMIEDFGRVSCNIFEIIDNQIYDLLNYKNRLRALEDSSGRVQLLNITTGVVDCPDKLVSLLKESQSVRTTNRSSKNDKSSRSHAIVHLHSTDRSTFRSRSILFFDLAGSEHAIDRLEIKGSNDGFTPAINSSLLALKECIRKLDKGIRHIPYRQNKISLMLKDALTGRIKSSFIVGLVDGASCADYSENSLKYADRLMRISRKRAGIDCSGRAEKSKVEDSKEGLAFFCSLKDGKCHDIESNRTLSFSSSSSAESFRIPSTPGKRKTKKAEKTSGKVDCAAKSSSSDSSESLLQAIAGLNLTVRKQKKKPIQRLADLSNTEEMSVDDVSSGDCEDAFSKKRKSTKFR